MEDVFVEILVREHFVKHNCYQRPFHCMDRAQYRIKNSAFEGVPVLDAVTAVDLKRGF